VNNAGYGYRAAVEEGEDDAVRQLFDTHVFGPVRMTKAVLPDMRARRAGTIVNISSIGARISPVGSGYYSAVKAALEALTLSLRKEVAPLGITAMVVEPGGFRTDFAGRSLTQAAQRIQDYADTAARSTTPPTASSPVTPPRRRLPCSRPSTPATPRSCSCWATTRPTPSARRWTCYARTPTPGSWSAAAPTTTPNLRAAVRAPRYPGAAGPPGAGSDLHEDISPGAMDVRPVRARS
jgi:NAD(P)-dependent dehydrogenase (short-subunit alcohol dehydrogenase family)